MENYKITRIWQAAFESEQANAYQSSVGSLVAIFERARENTKLLVSEIAVDLPSYTVHDISHLDALWEIGSQIVGPHFRINPVEGFILGCSFLFHDAAMTMAAYPGGLEEVKASREWRRVYSMLSASNGEAEVEGIAIELFLRDQHAIRAESLPKLCWKSDGGSRFLIDDAEVREKFGDFIGQVAASHWWNHSQLESRLSGRIIPAPAPFPSSWSIDLLKLACVLRTADASQIDERRAPGFLRALRRNRLPSVSAQHWAFQNKLTQAQSRSDTLYFAALRPFPREQTKEWWMLHDTLKMIDGELRKTDDVLARCRNDESRFAARRVANIESPSNLMSCIPTDGWRPVDTAFSISDIPKLIENLGGSQLYGGDGTVAIREVIQNAMDAIRLRRIVDPSAPAPLVEVEWEEVSGEIYIEVRDNGVGMSESDIVDNLLSFGSSGWLRDAAIGEYNDIFPQRSSLSGQYGIGFFSIFMIGTEIEVKSRRFDATPDHTIILSFPDGLNSRPLLCGAGYSARMTSGGTRVRIKVDASNLILMHRSISRPVNLLPGSVNFFESLVELISRSFPASEIPVCVRSGSSSVLIDGRNWQTEPASEFLKRIEGCAYPGLASEDIEAALCLITEAAGENVGRAMLLPDRLSGRFGNLRDKISGAIVAKGAKVCSTRIRGVLEGKPIRAARDAAEPTVTFAAIQKWATEQARLLYGLLPDDKDQESIAEQVASLGGDIGNLKFCEAGGRFLSKSELREFLRGRNEIWVAQDAAISMSRPREMPSRRTDDCVSASCGIQVLVDTPAGSLTSWGVKFGTELRDIAIRIISDEFAISEDVIAKTKRIQNGEYIYEASAPSWLCDNGLFVYVEGFYFKRGMKLDDVDAFMASRRHKD